MATRTQVVWTCDRCGGQVSHSDPNWQPNYWATVFDVMPPKASRETGRKLAHICQKCRDELKNWLNPPEMAQAVDR